MEEFRGVKGRMPRQYVFEMLPPLRPRMFSIASDVEVRVSLLAFFSFEGYFQPRALSREKFWCSHEIDLFIYLDVL